MKNKALIALLISFLAFFPPKLFANEEGSNTECFDDIKKKVDEYKLKGGFNFVISKDAKQLQVYYLQADKKADLKTMISFRPLDKCSFENAEDLYKYYEDDFEKYIKEEALISPPDKSKQENENIVIFKSTISDAPPNSDSRPPNSELEEKKSPPIEKVDLDKASDQLISATKEIKNLFEEYELNEAPYGDASSELVKLVKQNWKDIEENRCLNKDKKVQLKDCQNKLKSIKSFKKNELIHLKHIEIFIINKEKIESCFDDIDGFKEKNCITKKDKIKEVSSSEYLNNLILENDNDDERLQSVYNGISKNDFVYKDFEKDIDDYVNEELIKAIETTKKDLEKQKEKEVEDKRLADEKKAKNEKLRLEKEFTLLFREQTAFITIDTNIENIVSLSNELIDTNTNSKNLDNLKTKLSEIIRLIDEIDNRINYINSLESIDQIIAKGTELKDYDKYKNLKDVKKIVSELQSEKNKRQVLIEELRAISSNLDNKKILLQGELDQLIETNTMENTIESLESKNKVLENNLKVETNSKLFYMWAFFISLISLLGFTAFYIYRFQQHRSSADHTLRSSFNEQYKQIINENKSLKQELEKIKNQIQSREQTSATAKERTFKSRFDDEQSQETKPKISPLNEMLSFYDRVLRDPNKIDAFTNTYQAIALDRQSRIISQGETILVKDNKGFSKSNFWMVFIDNRYILLPGRTLNVNVSSLIADNYRYARDLLSGIFSYKLGNEFKMLQFAELEKNGDSFKVIVEGSLSLPQT